MKQVAPAWTLRAAEEARSEIDAGSGPGDAKDVLVGLPPPSAQCVTRCRAPAIHIAAPFRINAASPLFVVAGGTCPGHRTGSGKSGSAAPPPARAAPDSTDDGALELRKS